MVKRNKAEKSEKSRSSLLGSRREHNLPSRLAGAAGFVETARWASSYIDMDGEDGAGLCCTAPLEAENAELRNRVVDLALEILDLQLRLRPEERTRWADFATGGSDPRRRN
jgi:hypothetical protein